jgi:predicted DNA-binding protein
MSHDLPPKGPGRPALGKQRVQLTLPPDVDALLDQLASEVHEDRSTIVKEAIIRYSEEITMKYLWRKWYKASHPGESAYFRFSRTVTVSTEDGSHSFSGPIHMLVRVDKGPSPNAKEKDPRERAMDFMGPFWGDVTPNPGLLIEINEVEAQRSRALKPLSVHQDGEVFDVQW